MWSRVILLIPNAQQFYLIWLKKLYIWNSKAFKYKVLVFTVDERN